jgi:CubicO group peptidase (beta-lactamase class C family)
MPDMPPRPPSRTGPWTSPISRRQLLLAGAAGTGAVLVRPWTSLGATSEPAGLNRFVRELMAAGKLPGLSAAIVRNGDVAWSRTWGLANIRAGTPVSRTTLFMLASVSKTVVATAVLQAVEEGLFELDSDVGDVLPFRVRNPRHDDEPITVRQLMTHTSSIRDNWTVLTGVYVIGDATMALGTFLRRYLTPGGADYSAHNYYGFGPGRSYRYCNIGAALAAFLVETASGIGFDEWCEARIFTPLGMTRAGWHLAGLPRAAIARPYRWSPSTGYVSAGLYGYPDYPDGALRTTAPQLARHLAMVMNGGSFRGARVLSAASVRELRRDQVPDLEPGQGLIWFNLRRDGRDLFGHDGGDDGVATVCFFDPDTEVGVIALANGDWRTVRGDYALFRIMDRLFDEAPRLG